MKKHICLVIAILLSVSLLAQKKITPETKSALLSIDIPADAKADKRFLIKLATEALLNMKLKPMQIGLKSYEYFFWKDSKIMETRGVSIIDSLIKNLKANSWTMAFDATDDSVIWLLKDNKPLILEYITAKTHIELYVGELDKVPAVTFQ